MKHNYLLPVLAWLCLTTSAWADISLRLPADIVVVAANGENTKLAGNIQLPDGLNQLAIRFVGELGRINDQEMAYSDVFVVTFKASNSPMTLRIPKIRKKSQLKDFNRDPKIRLTDRDGQPIAVFVDKLEKEGFQLMRNFQDELEDFNRSDSPAAIRSQTGPLLRSAAPTPAMTSSAGGAVSAQKHAGQPGQQANMAEKMLIYWYQQADEETRNRFKNWLRSH